MMKQANVNGSALAEAAHPVERLGARHRADDRAGRHEQQRLEEGVRHQVEQAGRVRAHRDAHDHVADLRHRRVGDHALDVGLHDRDRRRDEQRRAADDRADVLGRRRLLEQRMHARDQVDAGGHHRRGVDQRGDRRRALHRVREPRVQRDLGGLGERADEQQQTAGDDVRRVVREHVMGGIERRGEVDAAGVAEDEERPEHEADVAEHVDHERLQARARGRRAPVPERDQQVRGGADERPADDQQHEVPGEHEQEHREHEVVEVREVPAHARRRSSCTRPSTGGSSSRHRRRSAP